MTCLNFVYTTTNLVNGMVYCGVHSTSTIDDGYLGSGELLKKAIKKYGIENFKVTNRVFFSGRDAALEFEGLLVDDEWVKSKSNYNICVGGGCPPNAIGRKHTEESKKKMSSNKKGIPPSNVCLEAAHKANKGREHSEEEKKKRIISRQEGAGWKPLSDGHKTKIKNSWYETHTEHSISEAGKKNQYHGNKIAYLKDYLNISYNEAKQIYKHIRSGHVAMFNM